MVKRIVLAALVFVMAQYAFSSSAAAQTPNPCLDVILWNFPDPILIGWVYYGPGQGNYSYNITAPLAACPPPDAPKETSPRCPFCGEPISLATGTTYIDESDLRIPGLGGGLSLTRTWISQWPASQSALQNGMFGPNWRSTYEELVFMVYESLGTYTVNYLKYSRADGSFWSFAFGGGGGLAAPQNVSASLTTPTTANPYWTILFQNGEQRRFDSTTGKLTTIIDRNGNTTQLTYDGASRLVTVTDPASRHLTFTYLNSSSPLVTSVSSDVGLSLTYAYDAQGRLSQVTNPDLTTYTFAYNSQSLITSVTDSHGKILESHTYDGNARGLTSSRAQGVDAVTISYPNP
jgi:YD repeat-containing protein